MMFETKRALLSDRKFTESGMQFSGYASVFNVRDGSSDVVLPGAFSNSIQKLRSEGRSLPMLLEHGLSPLVHDRLPIGVWVDFREDEKGLHVTGRLAPTDRGREVYSLLSMDPPALDGLSIGFYPVKWTSGKGADAPRRILEEVELAEISLVTFPANSKARVMSLHSDPDVELGRVLAGLTLSLQVLSRVLQTRSEKRDLAYDLKNLVTTLRSGAKNES